jgi:quercetin dioxygenase-like cupin family protein
MLRWTSVAPSRLSCGRDVQSLASSSRQSRTLVHALNKPLFGCQERSNEYSLAGENIEIKKAGSQSSGKGPAEWFTGTVRIDPLFTAPDPALVAGAGVTFEPGARTAWHTHPLGQTLIVTAGAGWVQREGGSIEEIRPGDVVWFAPNEKHWHGATPTTAMTHIAIQEKKDGKFVDWMEHVTDQQYHR